MAENTRVMKTGTTTLGLICKEGIVLAADRRASGGGMVLHKHVKKIVPITENIAITTAGNVSDIQLLAKLLKAELKLKELQTNRKSNIKEAANLIAGFVYSNIRKMSLIPGITSFILAGKDVEGFHTYDIGVDGSVIKVDKYFADGSGMTFAMGVLEAIYKEDMSIEKGVKTAVRAVNASLQRDMASGNGLDVMTITKEGLKYVLEKEIKATIET